MSTLPVQFLLLTLAGWMTRDHQRVIAYLLAENAVLREHLRGRRLRFSDPQRCRFACAAMKLGRQALDKLDTLVTPDTLLRWCRRLVARKYDAVHVVPAANHVERLTLSSLCTAWPTTILPGAIHEYVARCTTSDMTWTQHD